ncbi:amine sulfotransferase-like [Watersipora subatra]|uniref:amine sulfotransferase-like n=1 Tax=Watersipora subatra TaxID=2589382 RepID=UPI00355ADADC
MTLFNEILNRVVLICSYVFSSLTRFQVFIGYKKAHFGIADYYEHKGIPQSHIIHNEKRSVAMLDYDNFRPDDIILFTYIKSGTHFTRDVITSIYKEKGIQVSSCFFELNVPTFLTPSDKTIKATGPLAHLDRAPSPRIFTTHLSWDLLPPKVRDCKVKVVHCSRNPKDVVCSMFEFLRRPGVLLSYISFDQFLDWFTQGNVLYGSYFDFVRSWYPHRNNSNVLHIQYEGMKKDLELSVRRLAKFIDIELSQEQIDRVVYDNTFKNKKKEKGDYHAMYRRGQSGAWRNDLSEEQIQRMDRWIEREMKGLDEFHLLFD